MSYQINLHLVWLSELLLIRLYIGEREPPNEICASPSAPFPGPTTRLILTATVDSNVNQNLDFPLVSRKCTPDGTRTKNAGKGVVKGETRFLLTLSNLALQAVPLGYWQQP